MRLIQEVLIVGINRDNCLPVLSMAHKRANSKSKEYYLTEILQYGAAASDNKSQAVQKKEEEDDNSNVGDENESVGVSIRSVSEQSSERQMVEQEVPEDDNEDIEEVKESEEKWHHLLGYSIDVTALHLPYILRVNWNGFLQLIEKELAFAVISKSLYFYKVDPTVDLTPLVDMLVQLRNFESVFELLKYERD